MFLFKPEFTSLLVVVVVVHFHSSLWQKLKDDELRVGSRSLNQDLFSLSNRPLIQSVSMVSSCIYVWDQRIQLGQDSKFTGSWFNSESYFKRLLTNIKLNKKYSHLIQGRGNRAHWDSDIKKQYHLEKLFLIVTLTWPTSLKTDSG